MIFRPVIHPVLLVLILAIAATFVFLSARRAARKRVMDIIRRSLIVLTVIVMGAGPSIPGEAVEVSSALEVYLVIDRTGSMAAEDWDGNKPRIDGVRNDVSLLMNSLAGSRFSILTWDSSVHTDMPLTSDASAVASYMVPFAASISAAK